MSADADAPRSGSSLLSGPWLLETSLVLSLQRRTTMPQWRQGTPAIGGHIARENRAFGQVELDLACGAIVIEGEMHGISHLEGAHKLGKFLCIVDFLPIGSCDDIAAK